MRPLPLLVSVSMGYGHHRAAHALSAACGAPVLEVDRPPLADAHDLKVWGRTRTLYEAVSRGAAIPVAGLPLRGLLDGITAIPRRAAKPGALARRTGTVKYLEGLVADGLGRGLVERLRADGTGLLTPFYATAVLADVAGHEDVTCVVTDVDVNRVWVSPDPKASRIRYAVPARRTARRLLAYGVDPARIRVTGFPLPPALTGGPDLATRDRLLDARLARLGFAAGSSPVHVVFAVGGAGAQRDIGCALAASLAGEIERGRVRLTLVAGTRPDTRAAFERFLSRRHLTRLLGQGVAILHEATFSEYVRRFDEAIAGADVLWTKPSELVFFGGLGIPLVLAPPIGAQERANGAFVRRRGVALPQPHPRRAAGWLRDRLADGSLAAAARAGARRMTGTGTWRILEAAGVAAIPSGSGRG